MKSIYTVMITIFFACITHAKAVDDLSKVQFYTEELYPYNYTQNGKSTGFSYELIKQAIQHSPISINFDSQVKFVPWSRAYNIALKEKNIAIFSTARTDNREKYFHWVGPIAHAQRVAITKKSSQIKIETADDLKSHTITVIQEDIGDHLTQIMNLSENTTKTYDLAASLRNLETDIADILIYNPEATKQKMDEIGLNADDYEFGKILSSGNFYIAISKATPASIANQLQIAIDNYKITQEYQDLRVKYDLHLFDKSLYESLE